MKLTYLPDDLVIVQDDADRPIVATLTMVSPVADADSQALGRAMAAAPQMLALLNRLVTDTPDCAAERDLTLSVIDQIHTLLDGVGRSFVQTLAASPVGQS